MKKFYVDFSTNTYNCLYIFIQLETQNMWFASRPEKGVPRGVPRLCQASPCQEHFTPGLMEAAAAIDWFAAQIFHRVVNETMNRVEIALSISRWRRRRDSIHGQSSVPAILPRDINSSKILIKSSYILAHRGGPARRIAAAEEF